ncbi:bifunctional DNA primase/polymerase [Deinococcus radiopugnans]|nr:bifunctional DNA primase/polymerase [Deinococcus radiopugnans]MBB6016932.1 hypothetical protein [Deinococcus radiopugnans ATCC 19172]
MNASTPDTTLLNAALAYLARDWSILPVQANGARAKQPHPILVATGHTRTVKQRKAPSWAALQRTRPTVSDVETWFGEPAGKGIAVITGALSGVVVLDLDGEAGELLRKRMGWNPHVRTGSGGYHLYLRHPGSPVRTVSAKVAGVLGQEWPGLDIRGDGGYAILPPSHNAAGTYEQLRSFDDLENMEILPSELRQLLNAQEASPSTRPPVGAKQPVQSDELPVTQSASPERLVTRALAQTSTGRNKAGFWLATQLRDNGYTLSEALPHMHTFADRVPATNAKNQIEPYTRKEAEQSLHSAFTVSKRYAWRKKNGS